jgi:hypothetical protein
MKECISKLGLTLWVAFCVLPAFGQIRPVFTLQGLAELQARYGGLDDEIQIRVNQRGVPLAKPRTFRLALIATNAVDGTHCVTNASGTKYLSSDRFAAIQEAEWFGATGDGTTDSTAAIRSAMQYCLQSGRPGLRFGAGTFLTDGVTNVGSSLIGGIALLGAEGQRTILRARSAGTVMQFANMRAAIIRDLWIDGNGVGTRGIVLSNCTHFTIQKCDLYNLAGKGIEFIGDNNYGHVVDQCNVQNCATVGVHLNAISTSAITVRDSTFQANAHSTNAVGIKVTGGSVNIRYRDNVFQSLKHGILLDGASGALQVGQIIKGNYFEVCSDDSIHFGSGQQNGVVMTDNYFYTDYTTNRWAVRSDAGAIIYGLTWQRNAITTDSGRGLCLTNAIVRNWTIDAGSVDIATDYELPDNATMLMSTPSQRLVSVLVTNFNAAASTNFQLAGDLLPNVVSLTASSNIAFQIVGSLYKNTDLTIRNAGTNVILFPSTGHLVRPGTEERFVAANGTWYRETGPYLRDSGGTVYGTLNVTNDLNVFQNSMIYGGLTVNGVFQQPWGYTSSGTYGSTNVMALGAKPGAMVGLIKDGFYYVFVGTNGATRFTTAIESVAATNVLTHVLGFTNDPAAGIQRQHSIAVTNLANLLGVSGGGGGSGTNRYVEQSITATNTPIAINNALQTTYVFTGTQTNSLPIFYYLPTNSVPLGAILHLVIQGTNVHSVGARQYSFVDLATATTNRLRDTNAITLSYTGNRWIRHGSSDWTYPGGDDGLFYGWINGGPQQIPIQGDAPFDGLEYVRKNQAWAVASGGGGGGGTNHNALTGLQGGTPGEYFHLTSAQHTDLTDAGDSTSHYHASDRARGNHTGTQLASTISDFSTNVWVKILSSLLRGNGIHFATNGPSNSLTISGWNLPGSNLTVVTNSDGSLTWSAVASSSTNGTPLSVNGSSILSLANLLDTVPVKWSVSGSNITLTITNLPQASVSNLVGDLAAKQAANTNLLQIATAAGSPGDILYRHASGVLTNLPAGSSGHVLTVASGVPSWQPTSGGGGGAGTNLFVNGLLRQPARITNSPTVTWATNANGDLVANATNAAGTTAEVMQRVGWILFDLYTDGGTDPVQSAWSNYVQNVQVGGVVTNAYLVGGPTNLVTARYSGGIDVQINLPLSGLGSTNIIVQAQARTRISTNNAYASTFVDVIGGSIATTNIPLIVGTTPNTGFSLGASNTPDFHRWTNSFYINVFAPATVGGSGGNAVALNGSGYVTNLATGSDISWTSSGGTTATPILTDSGTAGTFTNPIVTTTAKGRISSIVSGPEPTSQSRSSFTIFDELLSGTAASGGQGAEGLNNSGTVSTTTEAGRPGVKFVRTTAAGNGALIGWHSVGSVRGPPVGSVEDLYFEASVKVPSTLSGAAGTDQYALQVGFNSLASTTNTPGDGSFLVHQTNLLGTVNWAFITTSNSVSATIIDTGVAVTNSTWYTLGVWLDATNTIAFINGVPVATNTTRLPLGRNLNAIVRAPRYSGTTTIDALVDWVKIKWDGAAR